MDWIAEHSNYISAVDGFMELCFALLILVGVHARIGRIAPLAWLIVSYFAIESLVSFNRIFVFRDPDGTLSRVMLLELIGTVVIVLMITRASKLAGAISYALDSARIRAAEYERARYDYTQVVRHRIANPLTVIKGASQTLELDELDDEMRHALRLAIYEAAEQLEQISLEPTRAGDEEHEFDAIPRVHP